MRREGWIKDKGNGRIEGGESEAGEGSGADIGGKKKEI